MQPPFQSLTREPEARGYLAQGGSLTPIYIAPEDHIQVSMFNVAPSVSFVFFGRIVRPDGVTVPLEHPLVVSTDGAESVNRIPIVEGFLLSAGVRLASGSIVRGSAFAILKLMRGLAITSQQYAWLASGYVDSIQPLMWPFGVGLEAQWTQPGFMERIFPLPAVGAEFLATVPVNRAWRFMFCTFAFTTDATVANRFVRLRFAEHTGVGLCHLEFPTPQPASVTRWYTWANGLVQNVAGSGEWNQAPVPDRIVLRQNWRIVGSAFNMQPGDFFSPVRISVESHVGFEGPV